MKTSRRTTAAAGSVTTAALGFFTTLAGCVFTSLTPFTSFAPSVSVVLAQQTPTFRTRTDLVELDVSVLDKDRRPVRGLTKADFTVFEDGKPQEISIFEAIDVPDPEPPPVAWMRDVTPDVTTNETRVTRLWVVVVDDAMVPQEALPIKNSKQIVRDIVSKFGPDDLATIVFTTDSRQAQDFTNDRTKLFATLENYSPGNANWTGPPGGGNDVDPDWQFQAGAVLTLRNVMDALIAVPHQRKALIWVSVGIPHDFMVLPKQVPKFEGFGPTMHASQVHARIVELAKEVFALATRANVPVYPIDPCGLRPREAAGAKDKCALALDGLEFLETTALRTLGRAVLRTNDFTPGIDAIFEENKSYYVIGYTPTNMKPDGALRLLEVKVNREGVDVRTRDSYYAPKPGDGPPRTTNAALERATAAPVPINDLPLRATAAPFAIPGKARTAAVAIALGVRQPVPESASTERVIVTTELRTSAFTTEGDNKGTQRHTAKVTLRAGAQGDADYEALSRIDLPPGRYRLRLAAHHEEAGKTGTVMVDVVVPDFGRDAASMSGVVIGATPGRPSAPRDLFRDILPIIPTAQRSFTKTDRATALFYLYQNAGRPMLPVAVTVRVTDSAGAVLIREAQTLGIDRFVGAQAETQGYKAPTVGGTRSIPSIAPRRPTADQISPLRAAEFQYPLPLVRLLPGPYLLTFEATVGEVVLRRDVQFRVN